MNGQFKNIETRNNLGYALILSVVGLIIKILIQQLYVLIKFSFKIIFILMKSTCNLCMKNKKFKKFSEIIKNCFFIKILINLCDLLKINRTSSEKIIKPIHERNIAVSDIGNQNNKVNETN